MTVIAAIKNKKGKLMMAADRRSSMGWHQAQSMPVPKIRKDEVGVLRGATGDGHLCEILVDVFPMPECKTDTVSAYVHHQVRTSLEKFLIAQGYKNAGEGKHLYIENIDGVELVLGIAGTLWSIEVLNHHENLGIIKINQVNVPYATGCGGPWAWSVAHTLQSGKYINKETGKHPSNKEILTEMIMTSAEFSPGCDNKIDFISED